MPVVKIQYGQYIEEDCCEDCDFAGRYNRDGKPIQRNICPECGGQLKFVVGRWMYTKKHSWWGDYRTETLYHGFLRGRNTHINEDGTMEFRQHPERPKPQEP